MSSARIWCGVAAAAGFGAVMGLGFVAMTLLFGNDTVLAWLRSSSIVT